MKTVIAGGILFSLFFFSCTLFDNEQELLSEEYTGTWYLTEIYLSFEYFGATKDTLTTEDGYTSMISISAFSVITMELWSEENAIHYKDIFYVENISEEECCVIFDVDEDEQVFTTWQEIKTIIYVNSDTLVFTTSNEEFSAEYVYVK